MTAQLHPNVSDTQKRVNNDRVHPGSQNDSLESIGSQCKLDESIGENEISIRQQPTARDGGGMQEHMVRLGGLSLEDLRS